MKEQVIRTNDYDEFRSQFFEIISQRAKELRIAGECNIANKAGVSPGHYSMLKSGKRKLTLEMVMKIANAVELQTESSIVKKKDEA